MPYSFTNRLRRNSSRFDELNREAVNYTQKSSGLVIPIIVSPIFKRSFTLTTLASAIAVDRQYWAIYLSELVVPPDTLFTPEEGDTITRADGNVFEIVREDNNLPPYQFITSERNRVLVYTVMQEKGP